MKRWGICDGEYKGNPDLSAAKITIVHILALELPLLSSLCRVRTVQLAGISRLWENENMNIKLPQPIATNQGNGNSHQLLSYIIP